ncbi:hypothetical protein BDB00DRAFT_879300 [Zychaea mexicana]|uniref:uncharacterized protein n=1 Tax=Zychaea mexicana TaxID=64656 RepID=UPI0022FE1C80|nr:uncharacterized protein BDB00DRAFT_879300 [Zychaea mexicana]KAI9479537.1 hypothetical protein BDB00DRAFT_879300 [Zychaea mexicana]
MAEPSSKKKHLSAHTIPGTRVANRTEIFDDEDEMANSVKASDSQRMEALMQQLMGTPFDVSDDTNAADAEEPKESEQEEKQEEAFAFRLFSSKPVAQVNIKEKDDDTADMLAELAAKQQTVDFEQENEPDFIEHIQAAAVDYNDLLVQSKQPYYAMQYPKRVTHIPLDQKQQQPTKKHRKSKKRRDFEKAVREGRIHVQPNMRNPATLGGWSGWPGHRTRCHIISDFSNDIMKIPRKNAPFAGSGRGGRGSFRGRGRAR